MKQFFICICIIFLTGYIISPTVVNESSVVSLPLNSIPQINITNITVMPGINAVRITYNLTDAENDPCKISLRISSDSGKTFLYQADSVSGDIGYPVTPGNNKQLYWYYTASPLLFKAKLIADDLQPVDIQEIVNLVDSNRLKNNLAFIVGIRHRTAGVQHLQRVKDSIYNRFIRYNLQTSIQNFDYFGYNAQNFIGRLPGTTKEDTTYIVDGHFETVSISPGADDNGTAVAALLEIARILPNYNFRNTIKFIGFDLEEAGLVGSIRYVLSGIPSFEKIAGVFNFEMIGFYCETPNCQQIPFGFCTLFPDVCDSINAQQGKGNFITNVANVNSSSLRYLFDSCARTYVPQLRVISLATPGNGQITPDLRRSDHAPFWDAGYKALMLTDGANFRNYYYHTANDTYGTINFQFMTNVVKATLAAVSKSAGIQHSSYVISGFFSLIGISQISGEIPVSFNLYQNYPNPFNFKSKIKFQIAKPAVVKLRIFDILGREIDVPVNEELMPGIYEAEWNALNYPSGVYFYELFSEDYYDVKKMILIK